MQIVVAVADLELVCDYLIVLVGSQVQVAGEVGQLLSTHVRVTGARCDPATLPAGWQIISASHSGQQTTLILRADSGERDPAWTTQKASLEDVVLAYMSKSSAGSGLARALEVTT